MSYCVNCGVELDKSAKSCALCDAPVVNPFIDENIEPTPAPYSDNIFIPSSASRRYLAFILSVILLIPNIVCSVTNLIIPEYGLWAIYVNATSLLCFIIFIFPFLFHKVYPYLILILDTVSVILYIYFFSAMYEQHNWFLLLALPIVVSLGFIIAFFLTWVRKKKRDWPYILIFILADIGIYSAITELLFHFYYKTDNIFQYSIIIIVSCVSLICFFLFVAKNKRFRTWLAKRLFV
ncbi:MAG: hypothetical protein EOM05_04415 [Clostridia bacterium]|nr:hypothetical protein [Clostridia bacterium]